MYNYIAETSVTTGGLTITIYHKDRHDVVVHTCLMVVPFTGSATWIVEIHAGEAPDKIET